MSTHEQCFSYFQSRRQDGPRKGKEGNEQSSNIVEGLIEIVNLITDNPGLKSDLQDYFEISKREGKEDKRRITSELSISSINISSSGFSWSFYPVVFRFKLQLIITDCFFAEKKRREKVPENEVSSLDQMIKDYRNLVDQEAKEENSFPKDLDVSYECWFCCYHLLSFVYIKTES